MLPMLTVSRPENFQHALHALHEQEQQLQEASAQRLREAPAKWEAELRAARAAQELSDIRGFFQRTRWVASRLNPPAGSVEEATLRLLGEVFRAHDLALRSREATRKEAA